VKGIAIIIGLNLAALIGIYLYFKRRIDKTLRSNEVVAAVQEEVEQLVIELNQTTHRNVEIIEERINQLKAITARADKQIKLLTKEIEKKEKETDTYSSIKQKKVVPANRSETDKPEVSEQKSRRVRVLEMYRLGMNMEEIAKKLEMTMSEIELIISLEERKR